MGMNRRPLIWFAVCWVFGSASAAGLNSSGIVLVAASSLLLALASVLCKQATWQLAGLCLLAASLAASERLWADSRNVTALTELMAEATEAGPRAAYGVEAAGTILSAVEVDGDRVIFHVGAKRIHVDGEAAPREVKRAADRSHQACRAA